MAHGYPGEADTAAYLVHNPQDIGESLKTKEDQKEPDPVVSLMSLRTSRTNLVSGLPTPVTEGALDVSTTVASILDNNLFSVFGDIGVSDIWNFIRGMRYGPGKRCVFGYNPVYDGLMGESNAAFNKAMAAIEKRVSDERLKKEEKKEEDPSRTFAKNMYKIAGAEEGSVLYEAFVGLKQRRGASAAADIQEAVGKYVGRIPVEYRGAVVEGLVYGFNKADEKTREKAGRKPRTLTDASPDTDWC